MNNIPRDILKSGKDQQVHRCRPWVFSGAIKKIKDGEPAEGVPVKAYDNKDQYLGTGHYQMGSIAVRLLIFGDETIDTAFFHGKIEKAWEYRKNVNAIHSENTTMFRLIHAEGDGLAGLIIDYYNDIAGKKMHSIGMYQIRKMFIDC